MGELVGGKRPVLVTGAAGFIGFHVAKRLLSDGRQVVGFDSINDYYDPSLKRARLSILQENPQFTFIHGNLADRSAIDGLFAGHSFECVINLAAQAGVRYSLVNPTAYIESNIVGFTNILEACRNSKVGHLVYASSSSVYGANKKMPFSIHDNVDHPLSLYAATKKSNELIAHSYSHLFGLPTTGLRFFTAYGPWGRPDMAMFIFATAILKGEPLQLFNHGRMRRDFTYIDDIVEGIVRIAEKPAAPDPNWSGLRPDPGTSQAPYRVYNIGNNAAVEVSYVISLLEEEMGRTAKREFLPMQLGDVPETCADVDDLVRDVGFQPSVSIEEGVSRFTSWFKEYADMKGAPKAVA